MSTSPMTHAEAELIVSLADEMIPAEGVWPLPSRTDLARFIREHCHRESDVVALRDIAATYRGTADGRAEFLEAYQGAHPAQFRVLIDFVYLGYYSRPEVVRAIQVEFDCDYISPPQPRGYEMPLEFDVRPPPRGRYTATADVRRVDISAFASRHFWELP